MNETEIRERLFDLAAGAPERLTVPPELLRLVRRRVGITLASLAVFVLALGFGGIAGVRWVADSAERPAVQPSPTPVDQSPSPEGAALPEFRRDGEILTSEGRDLVAVDPRTGNTRTVVDGRVGNAAWSPDGRWLAFDWFGCTSAQPGLWVLSARGEPRRLIATDCPSLVPPWAWSPDGAQLATIGDALTLLDPSTGRATDLGVIVDVTAGPVWSPDGSQIAYGARGGLIYSVDVKSGQNSLLVQLPGNMHSIAGIDWSPDGARMAIVANVAGSSPSQHLYLMNADGSGLRFIDDNLQSGWNVPIPDPSQATAWSPDGTRLAYAAFSGSKREPRIWTISVDGSAPSLVASHINQGCCGAPEWSPDGSQIAVGDPFIGYWVVNAAGTGDPSKIDELTYLSWRDGWYFCYCYG